MTLGSALTICLLFAVVFAVGADLDDPGDEGASSSFPATHAAFYSPADADSGLRTYCWGHELIGCAPNATLFPSPVVCRPERERHTGRLAADVFRGQADFAYLKQFVSSMQTICRPVDDNDERASSLDCSDQLQFCRGRHLFLDLRPAQDAKHSLKYSMDVLRPGGAGGATCHLDARRLRENLDFVAPLQSWAPELRHFQGRDGYADSQDSPHCDVYVERPTIILKLDATVNYYHHFCDFFNLYASLLIEQALNPSGQTFDRDVNILIWENTPYYANFGPAFDAFTRHPLLNLNSFGRKRVCFRKLLLPLPPRMAFGLYYNTPLTDSCSGSGMFQAFSTFMLHRLGVHRAPPSPSRRKVRVTLLARQTRHRRILNVAELESALRSTGRYDVALAAFTHRTPFLEQLQAVHETDVLVGVHGSGLTHLLFLPPWAAVFELYDCGDPGCYSDLARLRGVKYVSWTNETLLYPQEDDDDGDNPHPGHPKFASYAFDAAEFVRLVDSAAEHVTSHPDYPGKDARSQKKDEL